MVGGYWLRAIVIFLVCSISGLQGAATSSSNALVTTRREDSSDKKRSADTTIVSRTVQPGIYELLERHGMPKPLIEIILDYEARNGAYKSLDSRFSRFPWNEIRKFFSYVHHWSRSSVRHHHIITPDEQQRESALGTVVQIGLSQHHKDLKYFRVSPSCMYKAYIDKGNLIVVDALYHNTYMEIRGGSELCFVDCNRSPTVGINENRVAALVMHDSKLFVYIWRIGESVPEQILPVPLDTVENVDQCMLSLGEESYASCLKVALYVPGSLEGSGVVYRWDVNIASVDHEYVPTVLDVSYEPSHEHRSMRWLAVLPDGICYLCIDRFNLLTNYDKKDGRGERLAQVGGYSNDLDMVIGSVVSVVNNVLCDVPAFLAKSEDDECEVQELIEYCDKNISDDFTKNSILQLLRNYYFQQQHRLCVIRTIITDGMRGKPTRKRTAALCKWPDWVLEKSNDLTWMIERIYREKRRLGTDSVEWDTLSPQEKNLLTTAPPVVRSFIASNLNITGALPKNYVQGNLDVLRFGKMTADMHQLHNEYVSKTRARIESWDKLEREWGEQQKREKEAKEEARRARYRREKERLAREVEEAKRRADECAADYAVKEKQRAEAWDRRAKEQEALRAQRWEEILRAAAAKEAKILQEQKERADRRAAERNRREKERLAREAKEAKREAERLAAKKARQEADHAERKRKFDAECAQRKKENETIKSIDECIRRAIEKRFGYYSLDNNGRKYLLQLAARKFTDFSQVTAAAFKDHRWHFRQRNSWHKRYALYEGIISQQIKAARFSDGVHSQITSALTHAYMETRYDGKPYDILRPSIPLVTSVYAIGGTLAFRWLWHKRKEIAAFVTQRRKFFGGKVRVVAWL